MPVADSTTSPEASSKKGAKSQGLSSWESDLSIWLLRLVTDALVEAELKSEVELDAASFEKRLTKLMAETNPVPPTETCTSPCDSDIPLCGQRSLACQQANLTFDNASDAASAALRTALGAWNGAIRAYRFAIAQADEQLVEAKLAATKAYDSFIAAIKDKNVEPSSRYYQYFTKKLAIAVALQAHTASAAAAADELAGAAGVLIGAAQTYKDEVKTAQSQRDIDEATADQTFWQNYETTTA